MAAVNWPTMTYFTLNCFLSFVQLGRFRLGFSRGRLNAPRRGSRTDAVTLICSAGAGGDKSEAAPFRLRQPVLRLCGGGESADGPEGRRPVVWEVSSTGGGRM